MKNTIQKALSAWGMGGAGCQFIAARENQVFRIEQGANSYALRLHRPGYRTDTELWSELQWMNAVARAGLHVPTPIPSTSGELLLTLDGYQIDVLSWLSGSPIGQTGTPLEHKDRTGLFHSLGREMARLHNASDAWDIPDGFQRCDWDREGLLGETPLWDRFWENPTLNSKNQDHFANIRNRANHELQSIEANLDYGLIHADLVRENVLVDGEQIQLIDFDDSGFGFRLFDVATTLLKNRSEPDYQDLRAALIEGYRIERPLDTDHLNLFLLLRALTYVGWIMTRMHEEGAAARNARFTENALTLARQLF